MGGAGPLLNNTRGQLNQLAQQIAYGAAWPVGFIHGGKGSPTDQHQVLAIAFRQSGSTVVLNISDNNWGDIPRPSCRVLAVDMSGSELMVYSNDEEYIDIKGTICETYYPMTPTASLQKPWVPAGLVRWSASNVAHTPL